ncbi:MAG: helix-turn-helix domain-containing protein [Nanoarchaeota archaeon]
MKEQEKIKAIELRKQGLSVNKIAKEVGASKGTVSVWVRDIQLTKEQKIQLAKNRNPGYSGFSTKEILAEEKEKRIESQNKGREIVKSCEEGYRYGCMLYWTKGEKNKNCVVFSNTDVNIMILFINFLRKYFNCNNKDFSISVTANVNSEYSSSDIENFWIQNLGIEKECLKKSTFKKNDKENNEYPYGKCRIALNNTDVIQQIYGSIQEIGGFVQEEWLY